MAEPFNNQLYRVRRLVADPGLLDCETAALTAVLDSRDELRGACFAVLEYAGLRLPAALVCRLRKAVGDAD